MRELHVGWTRRFVLALLFGLSGFVVAGQTHRDVNLAIAAKATTSFVSGHETISALNDDSNPSDSGDHSHDAYGNWPMSGKQWVQYDWPKPIRTGKIEVYWFDDRQGVRLPTSCRLLYWDGTSFVEAPNATGYGLKGDQFNVTTFGPVSTKKLRLEFDSQGRFSTGILDWKVFDAGGSPNFPPRVRAGSDRVVVIQRPVHLLCSALDEGKPSGVLKLHWSKISGPGTVVFKAPNSAGTEARFSKVGRYVLKATASDGELSSSSTLDVRVERPTAKKPLEAVGLAPYKVNSVFWGPRLKNVIVNWIPHCARKIDDPKLREGGIANFEAAALKIAGKPHASNIGAPFANAWVYNTLESMCDAVMLAPQGDHEVAAAQAWMRKEINAWIPKILGAQEPDGYLHTMTTLNGTPRWTEVGDHEGYCAGYFIEAALAHYAMTGGKDGRLYKAAKKLADCWVAHIGPAPKKAWFDGHQELEQALVQLGRTVNRVDGPGKGAKYVRLAKFLLDSRHGGTEYDQSHVPVTQQYEAVGHAVRAAYTYTGMAEIVNETGDLDYQTAVLSLWNSVVNRKYYVTGGIGSGETSEGFGADFSLPNSAYCESCADCGELFFQQRMLQAYQNAKFADLYEETLYNAILGSLDLAANNFTYTNPLDSGGGRYLWHGCPCCVGNIPRTLLQLPNWTYMRGPRDLYVNLYWGGDVTLKNVAGTTVRMVQTTDYPWKGDVKLAVYPKAAKRFAVRLRVPNRSVSELYKATPPSNGASWLKVNGKATKLVMKDGYAVLDRTWKPGDKIELALPLKVQRVKADSRILADRGRVALRVGPIIYNVESVDQDVSAVLAPNAPLKAVWRPDLLGGVMTIVGQYADGTPLLAIPNYARLNRGGRSLVWIRDTAKAPKAEAPDD